MIIGSRNFDSGTYVMGILNVTPDSFSDGGNFDDIDKAVRHAHKLVNDGADIIDIGGESTRPGYIQISAEQEIMRVCPVIEKIRQRIDIPISVDTYKSSVARAAIEAGADMVNDIWGLRYDNGEMADLIAKTGVSCCLMHNRREAVYSSFIDEVTEDLKQSVSVAKTAGIDDSKIMVDPGVGFAKLYEQNLQLIKHLEHFTELGYPVLLGASRKSVIGLALDLPAEERLEGTIAVTAAAVMKGCSFVRVHDVQENKRAITMIQAIMNA